MSLPLVYYADYKGINGAHFFCKLNKSIFGLKQACRQWFSKFFCTLVSASFVQCKADYSLFTKGSGDSFVARLVYVDDILLVGYISMEILMVKSFFKSFFLLKDLDFAKYFLGLELACSSQGIYIAQRKYCLQILEECGFLACKPTAHPMMPSLWLSATFRAATI